MFKIETHLHTRYSSSCGKLDAKTLLEGYRDAGYSAIVVTDHFNRKCFRLLGAEDWPEEKRFHLALEGYRILKEMAPEYGLRVYRGLEIRFDESENDYLLYNFPDSLLLHCEEVFPLGVAAFAPLAREAGALLIQAHPYRNPCTPAIACYLDGVEVCNCHPRQTNRNPLAVEYAQIHGKIMLSGSDCHRLPDIGRGGITVDRLPDSERELAEMIRKGEFGLIIPPDQQGTI